MKGRKKSTPEAAAGAKMRGHRSRDVGEEAQDLVRLTLRHMGLGPRKEDIDDGEDLVVELPNRMGRLERVYLQVKGSESQKISSAGFWRVRVRGNAVARYRRLAHPVVLIAVDLTSQEIRWADVHAVVGYDIKAPVVSVEFFMSPTNRLDRNDEHVFREALENVAEHHRNRTADVRGAIAQHEADLFSKDPRFRVEQIVTAMRSEYRVHALEPVDLNFAIVASPEMGARLVEALSFGRPQAVAVDGMRIDGSPLFNHLGTFGAGKVEIGSAPKVSPGALGWLNENGEFQRLVVGEILGYSGHAGAIIQFGDSASPLSLECRFYFEKSEAPATFNFEWNRWNNQRITSLPYFKALLAFAEKMSNGAAIALALTVHGEDQVVTSLGNPREVRRLGEEVFDGLRGLVDLREVCERYGQDAVFGGGDGLSVVEQIQIEHAGALARGETRTLEPQTYTVKRTVDAGKVDVSELALFRITHPLLLKAWGRTIATIPTMRELTGYRLTRKDGDTYLLTPGPESRCILSVAPEKVSGTISGQNPG